MSTDINFFLPRCTIDGGRKIRCFFDILVTPKLFPLMSGRASRPPSCCSLCWVSPTSYRSSTVLMGWVYTVNMSIIWLFYNYWVFVAHCAHLFFSSLTWKTGHCAPPASPIIASLILPAKLKIQYVEKLREKSQFSYGSTTQLQMALWTTSLLH